VRLDDDEVAVGLQREPFGVGHEGLRFTLGRLLQQQLRRGVHGFEPGRERADLRIELRQAPRLVGLVAHLAAQRLGDGAQAFQKARRVVRELAQRLVQRPGSTPRGTRTRAGPQALFWALRASPYRSITRRARSCRCWRNWLAWRGMSATSVTSTSVPMRSARLESRSIQVRRLRSALQANWSSAVAGRWCASSSTSRQLSSSGSTRAPKDESSRSWLATITCAPTSALRWS
jgi:hypothetical protein